MLDGDVAMTLGRLLRDELAVTGDLLVIDGLSLRDFDYIDIGRIRLPVEHRAGHDQVPGLQRGPAAV